MADFRKPKYSGSLNLAPECGPVLIELDTDAKTATASLEDPASQYTLQGGGGLDYVIPEQSFGLGTAGEAELHDVIFEEGLIIVKYVLSGFGGTSYKQYNYISDEEGTGYYPADPTDQSYIDLENGKAILHGNSGTVGTISAIRGF